MTKKTSIHRFLSNLDKSFSNHGVLAHGTEEAFVMPSQCFKGHKFCAAEAALSYNGFSGLREVVLFQQLILRHKATLKDNFGKEH